MSHWSRDILNDPTLTGYNKSALLGNTFWRLCIPEIRQSLCGWVRTAVHWWCGFITFMPTCKLLTCREALTHRITNYRLQILCPTTSTLTVRRRTLSLLPQFYSTIHIPTKATVKVNKRWADT